MLRLKVPVTLQLFHKSAKVILRAPAVLLAVTMMAAFSSLYDADVDPVQPALMDESQLRETMPVDSLLAVPTG
jgi:hypothetical protein